ncbi:MAG: MMPL family transporter [Candidatus Marinimicrobia bacterium]|nr:MMPL family transporter [Candidatus Neomarinimicrobiota bacterium]
MKAALIRLTLERPRILVLATVAISLVLISGIRFIHFEDDILKMLPTDMPSRVIWEDVEEQFGATEALLVSLGGEGTLFTPERLALIWDITRTLEDDPRVDEVMSLATMNRIDNVDGFLEVGDLMPHRDLSPTDISGLEAYLDANPEIADRLVSTNRRYAMMAVVPHTTATDEEIAAAVTRAVEAVPEGIEISLAGMPYVRGILSETVRTEVFTLMRIGLVVLALVLLLNLRSVAGLGMVLMVNVLSTASMAGFLGWMFHFTGSDQFNFTILNSSMPVILLTIATADGVHIITRFFREMRVRHDVRSSVEATMNVLMLPVFLTSITTIAGFISLVTSPLRVMTGYGIAISFGIFWAWVLSITLLPSVMGMTKWNLSGRALSGSGLMEGVIHRLGQAVLRRPRTVLAGGLALIVFSIIGTTMLVVEVNFLAFFKPSSPIRQSIEFVDDNFAGTLNLVIEVTGDMKDPQTLRQMETIQNHLETQPYMGSTVSLVNIVRKLHRTIMDDSVQYEIIPETRGQVANLLTLYSMTGDPDDFSSLVDYDYSKALISATVKQNTTGQMMEMVAQTSSYLEELPKENITVRFTGFPVFISDFVDVLITSSLRSLAVSLVLIILLSWFFFKSLLWGALAVLPLGTAIILNFGLMGWFGLDLNHVTALLTSIIIGVGVDFAVHFIAQYRHFISAGVPREDVCQKTIDDVGYPILLNVTAVSVGFSALLFSEFIPMGYMGGLVIISMVSCALGTLTILATVSHLMRDKVTAPDGA